MPGSPDGLGSWRVDLCQTASRALRRSSPAGHTHAGNRAPRRCAAAPEHHEQPCGRTAHPARTLLSLRREDAGCGTSLRPRRRRRTACVLRGMSGRCRGHRRRWARRLLRAPVESGTSGGPGGCRSGSGSRGSGYARLSGDHRAAARRRHLRGVAPARRRDLRRMHLADREASAGPARDRRGLGQLQYPEGLRPLAGIRAASERDRGRGFAPSATTPSRSMRGGPRFGVGGRRARRCGGSSSRRSA